MNIQENINYARIEKAVDFILNNFKEEPNLDEVAERINLSPFQFQQLFLDWAGTTPKRFLQYITLQYAKKNLKDNKETLFDKAYQTDLSETCKLHNSFIKIEGMLSAEYKSSGKNLSINYSFANSPFGNIIIASTAKGVCYLAFTSNVYVAFEELKNRFPNATFRQEFDLIQQNALMIFQDNLKNPHEIKLHIKGTDFQLKVWDSLLKIPMGHLTTYSVIAQKIGNPKASRAIGLAIGSNPVAFLIPCHRVIQSSGIIGGYMWGHIRKTAIIGWEGVKADNK